MKKTITDKANEQTTMQLKGENIINGLSYQMDSLIVNQSDLKKYNENEKEKEEISDEESFGSISSADERDVSLLTTEKHRNYFSAAQRIDEFVANKMKEKVQAINKEKLE